MQRTIVLPDSSHMAVPDGVSDSQAYQIAKQYYPDSFPQIVNIAPTAVAEKKPQGGIFSDLFSAGAKGAKQMVSQSRTGIASLFGNPEEQALAGLERSKALEEQYKGVRGTDVDKIKEPWERGEYGKAALEAASQSPYAIAENLPQIAGMGLGTIAGGTIGTLLGPAGTAAGAVAGRALGATIGARIGEWITSAAQQRGSNVERQAQEQIQKGEQVNIDSWKASTAAAGQGALDVLSFHMLGGAKIVGKILGKTEAEILKMPAATAEKLVQESFAKTAAKGLGTGFLAEIPNELGQTLLERWQAGLDLTSPEALKEYGDTAIAVGLLAPLGAAGRFSEKSTARGVIKREESLTQFDRNLTGLIDQSIASGQYPSRSDAYYSAIDQAKKAVDIGAHMTVYDSVGHEAPAVVTGRTEEGIPLIQVATAGSDQNYVLGQEFDLVNPDVMEARLSDGTSVETLARLPGEDLNALLERFKQTVEANRLEQAKGNDLVQYHIAERDLTTLVSAITNPEFVSLNKKVVGKNEAIAKEAIKLARQEKKKQDAAQTPLTKVVEKPAEVAPADAAVVNPAAVVAPVATVAAPVEIVEPTVVTPAFTAAQPIEGELTEEEKAAIQAELDAENAVVAAPAVVAPEVTPTPKRRVRRTAPQTATAYLLQLGGLAPTFTGTDLRTDIYGDKKGINQRLFSGTLPLDTAARMLRDAGWDISEEDEIGDIKRILRDEANGIKHYAAKDQEEVFKREADRRAKNQQAAAEAEAIRERNRPLLDEDEAETTISLPGDEDIPFSKTAGKRKAVNKARTEAQKLVATIKEERLNKRYQDALPRVAALIEKRMKQLGLAKFINVEKLKSISVVGPDGKLSMEGKVNGAFLKTVIQLAVAGKSDAQIMSTLNHEAIHAMRELGMITEPEWTNLSKVVENKGWINLFQITERYTSRENVLGKTEDEILTALSKEDYFQKTVNGQKVQKTKEEIKEDLVEEAIADAFSTYATGRSPIIDYLDREQTKPVYVYKAQLKLGGQPVGIITRIIKMLKGIRDVTDEDVFKRIQEAPIAPTAVAVTPTAVAAPRYSYVYKGSDKSIDRDNPRGYKIDKIDSSDSNTGRSIYNIVDSSGEPFETFDTRADAIDYIKKAIDSTKAAKPKLSIAVPKTEAFKQFSADSKVVDKDGNPVLMYHATQYTGDQTKDNLFSKFTRSEDGKLGEGVYTTSIEKYAENYVPDGTVMPLWVSMKNPLYIDLNARLIPAINRDSDESYLKMDSNGANEISNKLDMAIQNITNGRRLKNLSGKAIRLVLKKAGYDGVLVRDRDGNFVEANVFEPTQLKSAVGNVGTYNPKNPDIRYSKTPNRVGEPKTKTKSQNKPSFYKDLLPNAGFNRLPIESDRTYKDKSGQSFLTFERDGVRVAFASNQTLYFDGKAVGIFFGDTSDSVFHALIVDPQERKKGKATIALTDIIRSADESKTDLYIQPTSLDVGAMKTPQLVEFYKRFGFQSQKANIASDKVMVRLAQNKKTTNPDIRYSKTPEFKRWTHGNQIINLNEKHKFADGVPVVVQVVHGTTGDYEFFDRSKLNQESDLGAGFYFTNTVADANANYAGMGPDLTNKINRTAERIADQTDREYDDPDVIEEARNQFLANEGQVMPVYVRFDNPVVLGGKKETFFYLDQNYDEKTEEYGEPTGKFIDFIEAFKRIANDDRYGNVNVDKVISDLFEEAIDNDGISANDLIKTAKESDGLTYAEDYEKNGELASTEIIRQAFEEMGYDGFIDQTVVNKFSRRENIKGKVVQKPMEGVTEDTVHFIAFKQKQIKSSVGNLGSYGERPLTKDELEQEGITAAEAEKRQNLGYIRYSATAPVWYSELSRQIDKLPQKEMTAAEWKALLVNPEEIKSRGVRGPDNKVIPNEFITTKIPASSKLPNVKMKEIEDTEILEWLDVEGTSFEVDDYIDVLNKKYGVKKRGNTTYPGWEESDLTDDELNKLKSAQSGGRKNTKISTAQVQQFLADGGSKIEFQDVVLGTKSSLSDAEAQQYREYQEMSPDDFTDESFDHYTELEKRFHGAGNTTKFDAYNLPGGTNYREAFVTVPNAAGVNIAVFKAEDEYYVGEKDTGNPISRMFATQNEAENSLEGFTLVSALDKWVDGHSPYSGIDNPVVRIRFDDRVDSEGKKVLFLQELQPPNNPEFEKMPKSLQDRWLAIGLKRMIRHAAEDNYDKIAWTTGEQQVERYRDALRASVDSIEWEKTPEGVHIKGYKGSEFSAFDNQDVFENVNAALRRNDQLGFDTLTQARRGLLDDGLGTAWLDRWDMRGAPAEDIAAMQAYIDARLTKSPKLVADTTYKETDLTQAIGKLMADRIRNDPSQTGTIEGEGLSIDAVGVKKLYDVGVPSLANKILKEMGGGKVGEVSIQTKELLKGNEKFTYSRLADLTKPEGEQNFVVESATEKIVAGPFKTSEKARDWLRANDPAFATKQPSFDITPPLREKALSGVPRYSSTAKKLTPKERKEEVRRILAAFENNLLPEERKKLTLATAQKLVNLIKELPSANELTSVALAGIVKRGWYRHSAEAIANVFGGDGPRFTALLAATSPQTSVESNLRNALNIWKNWTLSGRPSDPRLALAVNKGGVALALADKVYDKKLKKTVKISRDEARQILADRGFPMELYGMAREQLKIMGESVEGNRGEASVLDAWIGNSMRALNAEDSVSQVLSGPKVNSFYRNLIGFVNEVTNDAWMANFAGVDQKIFAGGLNAKATEPGKGFGYMAMNVQVRKAANLLTKMTNDIWTPSEVQETIWSWAKTALELASEVGRPVQVLVRDKSITDDLINATPDFRTLFHAPEYQAILEGAGYAEQLRKLVAPSRDNGLAAQKKSSVGSEAEEITPNPRHLIEAARRLETLRQKRITEKAETVARNKLSVAKYSGAKTTPATKIFGGSQIAPVWAMPNSTPSSDKIDNLRFLFQDRFLDLDKLIQAVKATGIQISDQFNAYLKETLFHGRVAEQSLEFTRKEIDPLLQDMKARGVSIGDIEKYLHNRHAEERNNYIATINTSFPDGGSGIKTQDARNYLNSLSPTQRADYIAIAAKVDAMMRKTNILRVSSGLAEQGLVDAWNNTYTHYVPLQRDMEGEETNQRSIGQGFSVSERMKRAMGSTYDVENILSNIVAERERIIVKAEKNNVTKSIFKLALMAPNPDFWLAVDIENGKNALKNLTSLLNMGLSLTDATNIAAEPMTREIDPATGHVVTRLNPTLRRADNVLHVMIDGKEKIVIFNKKNKEANRLVRTLKNLDMQSMGYVMGSVANITRYFASVNTQYNPIFGVINFMRDVQTGLLNLTNTPIANKKSQVLADTFPALRGIWDQIRKDANGQASTNSWGILYKEFEKAGGPTGYREMFTTSEDRSDALAKEFKRLSEGKIKAGGRAIFNALSDYNTAMENAVRLAAYKAAKDSGLSIPQAAYLAKNLTVNFNKKGDLTREMGALYAFFNASVQGTARIAQTLAGPAGRKIIGGGLLLGSMQAMLLAASGFGDDEPPEFIKEKNIVIPTGDGKYITIPMPLGFNLIPNTSRVLTEIMLEERPNLPKKLAGLFSATFSALAPTGGGPVVQMLTPTIADPLVALAQNKDAFGRRIYKEDFSGSKPTAGYLRTKETATPWAKGLAEFLNYASGGTQFKQGVFSPTPDQIDYLIGQATGGVGREVSKFAQTFTSLSTGEELPSYKVPLVSRFFGDTKETAAEANKFYENLKRLNEHGAELDGYRKNPGAGNVGEYLKENPEARLVAMARHTQEMLSNINKQKRLAIQRELPKERVKQLEELARVQMHRLNERVEALR